LEEVARSELEASGLAAKQKHEKAQLATWHAQLQSQLASATQDVQAKDAELTALSRRCDEVS
jgi:hypothetical protein